MANTVRKLLLLVAVMLSAAILPRCYGGKKVVVSESAGIDNDATACWSAVGECSNLTMALEGVSNDTTVAIKRGTYTLRRSARHEFNQLKNVAISGLAPAGEVVVNCNDGAGLTFLRSATVNISNVSFYGCGYEHTSNSLVRTSNFAQYKVALFFQLCRNVTLNQVEVSYSKGIAVQFFATIGNNEINGSLFMNNMGEDQKTVGGGVYIEFPYCLPGNQSCITEDTSTVPVEFRSGGNFRISHSNFSYNVADPPKDQRRVFMVPHLANHISFGRGGGLSVFFKGNSNLSSVIVSHSHFVHNKAVFGGGVFVDFQDNCHNNTVMFDWCSFDSNLATQEGGGLRLNFASSISSSTELEMSDMHYNIILIVVNTYFKNEAHASGGGMFFGATRENSSSPTNKLNIAWGNWTGNIAPVGSAISMIGWTHGGAVIAPELQECLFHANGPRHIRDKQSVGKGTVYLDSIPLRFTGVANFTNNQHTAIAGVNTGIYFKSSNYKFINNWARQGGAIALLGNAFLMVDKSTTLEFINNTAYYLGGAIFATLLTGQDSISSGNCFIRYYELMTKPNDWDIHFKFINNTAMNNSNAIYTSSAQPCLWGRAFGPPHDDQGMSTVFCWNKNISTSKKRWDYGSSECRDEIMSAPSKFGKNNKTTVEINLDVMPGIWNNFNLTTLDDFGHNVSDHTVFAARSLNSDVIVLSDHSHYLEYNSILLHQPNHAVKNGTVVLQTVNTPNPILAFLNVTFMECPPGFNLLQGQCMCIAEKYEKLVHCDTNPMSIHSDIMRGYWIGDSPYNNNTNTNEIVMAICQFCFYENNTVSVKNFTDVQNKLCHKIHRTGTLCSQCNDGYCFAVNSESYDCIKYDHHISLALRIFSFILYKFLFPLVFLWIVYRFGITIASGKYNAPVFFAQMITTVIPIDLDGALSYPPALKKLYYVLYDMLNLELRLPDFGRFCIHPEMSVTMVIALNYCVALLPLLIVIAMAIVYKCDDMGNKVWCCYFEQNSQSQQDNQAHSHDSRSWCKKVFWCINRILFSDHREYLVSAVAAFFVLSYMKIAVTTSMLITPNKLINGEGYVLYMDGSKCYPQDILPYLILALIWCVYLFMVPLSLLILRYGDQNSEGFLHYLLVGLQANFRSLPSSDQRRRYILCCKDKVGNKDVPWTGVWRTATFNTETELYSVDFKCCSGSSCFCSCGAHDFRWVSGAYFVLRILMLISYIALPTDMIQMVFQMLISCAAAAFFIIFQPYGYNHTEQKGQQELTDTARGNIPTYLPRSPSNKYNQLDAAVFLALAMVIAICMYRLHLTNFGSTTSIPVLTLQSILLFLPAAWFALHILFFIKKRWSAFRCFTRLLRSRRRGGKVYDGVPINDDNEDHKENDERE